MDTPIILRWQAHEHEHIERGSDWFWALGIAAVCLSLTAILFHNLLFGILIVLAAATIASYARVPPPLTSFEISVRGIRVGDTLHRFDDIISFWVEEGDKSEPVLFVDTTAFMSPNLIIPLVGVDADAVHAFLFDRCTEVPMKEPLSHKILETFGF